MMSVRNILAKSSVLSVGVIAVAPIVLAQTAQRDDQSLLGEMSAAYHEAELAMHGSGPQNRHIDLMRRLSREIASQQMQNIDIRAFEREFAETFIPAIARNDMAAASISFAILSRLQQSFQIQDADKTPTRRSPEAGNAAPEASGRNTPNAESSANHLYIIAGIVAAALLGSLVYWRSKIRRDTSNRDRRAEIKDAQTRAHDRLDPHLAFLRRRLASFGPPRVVGDRLYFGDYLVNGTNEIVDKVKATHGCFATIFVGDKRISTNVRLDNGDRALNTPLAHGPAYEAVVHQKRPYAGTVVLFDKDILALYEPVMDGEEFIGILFVGL